MKRDHVISCELVRGKQEDGTWIITTPSHEHPKDRADGRRASVVQRPLQLGVGDWASKCLDGLDMILAVRLRCSWLLKDHDYRFNPVWPVWSEQVWALDRSVDPTAAWLFYGLNIVILHVASLTARGLVFQHQDRFWRCLDDSIPSSLHAMFIHFTYVLCILSYIEPPQPSPKPLNVLRWPSWKPCQQMWWIWNETPMRYDAVPSQKLVYFSHRFVR